MILIPGPRVDWIFRAEVRPMMPALEIYKFDTDFPIDGMDCVVHYFYQSDAYPITTMFLDIL